MNQSGFGFGLPEVEWRLPEEMPPIPLNLDLGIDTETRDEGMRRNLGPGWAWPNMGYMIGASVSSLELGDYYFPVAHEGDNLDDDIVRRWLQEAVQAAKRLFFFNAQYDVGWLEHFGVKIPRDKIHDALLMEPLLDEHAKAYSLDKVALRHGFKPKAELNLDRAAKALGIVGNIKQQLWRIPARYVAEYAEQDASLARQLCLKLGPEVVRQGMGQVYTLERSLVPHLIDIRKRGVRVDIDRAEQTLADLRRRTQESLKFIHRETGIKADPWNALSIAQALHYRGVEVPRTPKSNQPSVTKEFLDSLEDPVAEAVRQARRWDKAAETFVKGHVLESSSIDGRVHAQLNQLMSDDGGTVSGRFSCSKPNLQQIPARDKEVMTMIRSLYLPEEGQQWAVLDYSQQEPRLTVHWASVAKARGAEEAVRKYHEDPTMSYHQMVADMTGLPYKQAKDLNLGMTYGMGGAKMCKMLGLPTVDTQLENGDWIEVAGEEGKEKIDQYHRNVPFVRGLSDLCQSKAKRKKYIKTILGRRCRFRYPHEFRKALNRLIQGSAADQTKLALLEMCEEGLHVLTTVHDEVDLSFHDQSEIDRGQEIMEHCIELRVPSKVDIEVGPTWGEVY